MAALMTERRCDDSRDPTVLIRYPPLLTRASDAFRVGAGGADPPKCYRYHSDRMSTGVIAILLPGPIGGQGVRANGSDLCHPLSTTRREACLASRRHRVEGAVEREQPDVVAFRRGREHVAGRVRDDVLLAVVRENADGRIHAGTGLELPKLLTALRVERRKPAVVAPDENEPAGRCRCAAIAAIGPVLLPYDRVRAHVHRRERAVRRERIGAERPADEVLAGRRSRGADLRGE